MTPKILIGTLVIAIIIAIIIKVFHYKNRDLFLYLEEVEGKRALNWVNKENERTIKELTSSKFYPTIYNEIKEILFAKDKVPFASFSFGYFYNFWQDETSKHGILRRTTYKEYLKENPKWETLIDLDELSKSENENWVYKGWYPMDKGSSRYLIHLSRGGGDATTIREFDIESKEFVKNGFYLLDARQEITLIDENNVIVGTDYGKGSLSAAGYPLVLKLWKRGEDFSKAKTIYKGEPSDTYAYGLSFRDNDLKHIILAKGLNFYHNEYFLWKNNQTIKLPIPKASRIFDIRNNLVYLLIQEEDLVLDKLTVPRSSIFAYPLEDTDLNRGNIIFTAKEGESITDFTITKEGLYLTILDNIKTKFIKFIETTNGWKQTVLPFPEFGSVWYTPKDDYDPTSFATFSHTDFLTPSTLYQVKEDKDLLRLKNSPERFDASNLEIIQNFAISSDGTKVPYFLAKKKDLILDGTNPTLLYGYGGFQVSLLPYYMSIAGKIWLERGGVYVLANIRGGGELGEDWHLSAKKENRQRSFDDFIAIAEDLIEKKITSSKHLGIQGGSNGGLLVGVVMTQRPELFNAVSIHVPLLDMIRYTKLLAGQSWMEEYGDPDDPRMRSYLLTYSPYHNLKDNTKYPTPFFITSTKDDRVHPGHARKMAALMQRKSLPFYYYENTEDGGHSGDANLESIIKSEALDYTYLWEQLE